MFPGQGSGLSLTRVLSGISKTLNIAREIIPIYEQTKPMIQNAKKTFLLLKEVKPSSNKSINTSKTNQNNYNKKTTTVSNSSINNPSFFK